MWAAWDFITQKMIPESMIFEKPIDLRHICLFYTGHIPAFLDIHISRLLGEPHTEPEYFKVRLATTLTLGDIHARRTSSNVALIRMWMTLLSVTLVATCYT